MTRGEEVGDSAKAAGGTRKVEIRVMGPGDTIANVATKLATPSIPAREVEALLRSNNALPPACARIDGACSAPTWSRSALSRSMSGPSDAHRQCTPFAPTPVSGVSCMKSPGSSMPLAASRRCAIAPAGAQAPGSLRRRATWRGGGSAYAFTMERHLGAIAQMADELRVDALAKFGSAASPFQLSQGQSPALGQWLQMNPTYHNLRKSLDDLPRYIRNRMGTIGPSVASPAGTHGRWFRGQFVLPHTGANPGAYVGRVARRLGGQVLRYGKIGTRLTWYVPAVLGVYERTSGRDRGGRCGNGDGRHGRNHSACDRRGCLESS